MTCNCLREQPKSYQGHSRRKTQQGWFLLIDPPKEPELHHVVHNYLFCMSTLVKLFLCFCVYNMHFESWIMQSSNKFMGCKLHDVTCWFEFPWCWILFWWSVMYIGWNAWNLKVKPVVLFFSTFIFWVLQLQSAKCGETF